MSSVEAPGWPYVVPVGDWKKLKNIDDNHLGLGIESETLRQGKPTGGQRAAFVGGYSAMAMGVLNMPASFLLPSHSPTIPARLTETKKTAHILIATIAAFAATLMLKLRPWLSAVAIRFRERFGGFTRSRE